MPDPENRDVDAPPQVGQRTSRPAGALSAPAPAGGGADDFGYRSTGGRAASPDGRVRILMLAANPATITRLAIEEEAREITEKLRLSQDRDTFELITCWAVRAADLLQQLNQHRPHVVHFSGHGDADGDIVLSAGDGEHRVGTEALAELFRTMKDNIRVVVLNAGHSAAQARAISRHIDYVIGMRAPVDDRAAAIFAAAFYSALGFHRTIQEAFDQATAALMLHGGPDHLVPELTVRPGADPRVPLYDAAPPARARRRNGHAGDGPRAGGVRRTALLWSGLAAAAVGLAMTLVAWVGQDRTRVYVGVPGSILALLGVAAGGYAVATRLPGRTVRQVLRDGKVGGANVMIGQAGAVPEGPDGVDQSIRNTRIAGDNTMIGVDLRREV